MCHILISAVGGEENSCRGCLMQCLIEWGLSTVSTQDHFDMESKLKHADRVRWIKKNAGLASTILIEV